MLLRNVSGILHMPPLNILPEDLRPFGTAWDTNNNSLSRTLPNASMELGKLIDNKVGIALAQMLGNIMIYRPNAISLIPRDPDCVKIGPVRIIGAI